MRLKVGELARRSGLTVRTLHHYHAIGLLTPSARADNGYRLYGRDDIARLHQIQAMRRFGLPLAEIGAYLDQPATPLDAIISKQIAMLDRQIQQAARLRERLAAQVRDAIDAGQAPDSAVGLELARQWMALFCTYAGNDPATHAKFRQALMTDPELTTGTWADDATLSFMRRAMGVLAAAR